MPTYEYLCQACGTRFEVWQKMSDDALTTCQACGGPVRRVLYPAGIVFKGGGFYSTDHRSNGAKAANGDGARAAEGAKDSATTTDAKSGAATSAAPTGGAGSAGATPTSGSSGSSGS
ncbi:MAG TPA: FmdB family zinc ribbon protein [Ktedonobacterales bacterium]